MITAGIYQILNKVNGKSYIGQSKEIERRWNQHKNQLRNNKHKNIYLQRAWNKYGEENFNFIVLQQEEDKEELNRLEIYFIKKYNSMFNLNGYNITEGGLNYKLSLEGRKRLRGLGSVLSQKEVREIKLALYCLMDRKEIAKKYNVDISVISSISQCKNFEYVCSELNEDIKNLKKQLIDKRNKEILKDFDNGKSISEISKKREITTSIVEKCIYKYRNPQQISKNKYKDIYDKVKLMNKQGIKNYQIAKQLKISPSTVQRYLAGVNNPYKELPYKKIKKEVEKEILDQYGQGVSIKDIALKLKVSRNTIEFYINKNKYANTEVS